jgi:hypothetical protein
VIVKTDGATIMAIHEELHGTSRLDAVGTFGRV